jgi:hypothetical protein
VKLTRRRVGRSARLDAGLRAAAHLRDRRPAELAHCLRRPRRRDGRASGRAEVRRYPIGHFDVYVGAARDRAIADQLHFLRRHLAVREREDAAA